MEAAIRMDWMFPTVRNTGFSAVKTATSATSPMMAAWSAQKLICFRSWCQAPDFAGFGRRLSGVFTGVGAPCACTGGLCEIEDMTKDSLATS